MPDPAPRRTAPRRATCVAAAGLLAAVAVSSGCARFDESAAEPFSPEPTRAAHAQLNPPSSTAPTTPPPSTTPPSGPCVDPNPIVVETCLDTTGGLAVLPDAASALVGERLTGRILRVEQDSDPAEFATVAVDGSGDGGLLAVALSPTYAEDRLVYAYISTPTDNRVVRVASGDTAKTVLAGIPRGVTGNGGAIAFDGQGALLVRTGDAGSPAAATDPGSLAGKLLKVADPTPGRASTPEVLGSGLGPGGMCVDPVSSTVWVTDRAAAQDRLLRTAGAAGLQPVWSWPDRPGVAHCAAIGQLVGIAATAAKSVLFVETSPDTGLAVGDPVVALEDVVGALYGAALSPDGLMWASTVNKTAGTAGETDDRVLVVPFPGGAGGASGPD